MLRQQYYSNWKQSPEQRTTVPAIWTHAARKGRRPIQRPPADINQNSSSQPGKIKADLGSSSSSTPATRHLNHALLCSHPVWQRHPTWPTTWPKEMGMGIDQQPGNQTNHTVWAILTNMQPKDPVHETIHHLQPWRCCCGPWRTWASDIIMGQAQPQPQLKIKVRSARDDRTATSRAPARPVSVGPCARLGTRDKGSAKAHAGTDPQILRQVDGTPGPARWRCTLRGRRVADRAARPGARTSSTSRAAGSSRPKSPAGPGHDGGERPGLNIVRRGGLDHRRTSAAGRSAWALAAAVDRRRTHRKGTLSSPSSVRISSSTGQSADR